MIFTAPGDYQSAFASVTSLSDSKPELEIWSIFEITTLNEIYKTASMIKAEAGVWPVERLFIFWCFILLPRSFFFCKPFNSKMKPVNPLIWEPRAVRQPNLISIYSNAMLSDNFIYRQMLISVSVSCRKHLRPPNHCSQDVEAFIKLANILWDTRWLQLRSRTNENPLQAFTCFWKMC